jgi:hypothetical protein
MNERPQPRAKTGIFDALKTGYKRAVNLFGGMFKDIGENVPTQNEMRLDADEWAVKQKLGRAFFTKRLNPNTKVARVASLTGAEYQLARQRGWVR